MGGVILWSFRILLRKSGRKSGRHGFRVHLQISSLWDLQVKWNIAGNLPRFCRELLIHHPSDKHFPAKAPYRQLLVTNPQDQLLHKSAYSSVKSHCQRPECWLQWWACFLTQYSNYIRFCLNSINKDESCSHCSTLLKHARQYYFN